MSTLTKQHFSASTDGRGIKVVQTATTGTTIHTCGTASTTTDFDEIWIYAVNTSVTTVKLTIEFGNASTDDNIEASIYGESGLVLVIPGLILQNSLVVKAFAGTANVIILHGYVNEYRA